MKKLTCLSLLIFFFFISTSYSKTKTAPQYMHFQNSQYDVIKIMTFNIKTAKTLGFGFGDWDMRKSLVCEMIQDHAPDVFGLQEPVNGQVQDVQQAFLQYASYYVFGGGNTKGQTCPVFWRKDRFRLLDSGTFWFSNDSEKAGAHGWGNMVPRFCSWVSLQDKNSNIRFYVYNTHLDSLSQSSREKSVRLLAKEIAARPNEAPFVIMGDLNMRCINSAMQFLFTESPENQFPVIDAWLSVHPDAPETSSCNFGGMGNGPQLDHIALGLGALPVEVQIDNRKFNGKYPSDHFPVIAKIELPSKPMPAVAKTPQRRTSEAPY